MKEKIIKELEKYISKELLQQLFNLYQKLKNNFSFNNYESILVKGGKIAEVMMRILEYLTKKGKYTPLWNEVSLDNLIKNLEQLPKEEFSDSLRIYIPRILKVIYTIRSRRGGAHINEVNPNLMDATLIISLCDWIIAELIRLYYKSEPNEAQKIINSMVEKKIPLIEKFNKDILILYPHFSVKDKILVILYYKHPLYVSVKQFKKWIETKSKTHIPTVLRQLCKEAKIYRKENTYKITRSGISYVEKKILPIYWEAEAKIDPSSFSKGRFAKKWLIN